MDEEFSEKEEGMEDEGLIEKTKSAPPKQKELLKKQTEFELGQKEREVEDIKEGEKKSRLEKIFTWFILFLVAVGLFLLARWLLF